MTKEEQKRTFESEALALPPLKMVLVNAGNDPRDRAVGKEKNKVDKGSKEETVLRIIDRLIAKE